MQSFVPAELFHSSPQWLYLLSRPQNRDCDAKSSTMTLKT